jgi:anti-sigma factor RsiW
LKGHEHDPNLIAAYFEGRLQGGEKDRFTEHLAACAECRATLALMAREAEALGTVGPGSFGRGIVSPRVWLPVAATLVVATVVGLRSGWLTPAPPAPSPAASLPAPAVVDPSTLPPRSSPPTLGTPPPPTPAVSGRMDDGLLVKRGGERRVAGKTFRLVAGEWRDAAFDPLAGLPVVDVHGARERSALLSRLPALGPYAGLGPRVAVVHEGTVYRFRPPSP